MNKQLYRAEFKYKTGWAAAPGSAGEWRENAWEAHALGESLPDNIVDRFRVVLIPVGDTHVMGTWEVAQYDD